MGKFSFHITDYLPILSWLPAYIKNSPQKHIGGDIVAGLTVIIFYRFEMSITYNIKYWLLTIYEFFVYFFSYNILLGWCTYYATSYRMYNKIYIF